MHGIRVAAQARVASAAMPRYDACALCAARHVQAPTRSRLLVRQPQQGRAGQRGHLLQQSRASRALGQATAVPLLLRAHAMWRQLAALRGPPLPLAVTRLSSTLLRGDGRMMRLQVRMQAAGRGDACWDRCVHGFGWGERAAGWVGADAYGGRGWGEGPQRCVVGEGAAARVHEVADRRLRVSPLRLPPWCGSRVRVVQRTQQAGAHTCVAAVAMSRAALGAGIRGEHLKVVYEAARANQNMLINAAAGYGKTVLLTELHLALLELFPEAGAVWLCATTAGGAIEAGGSSTIHSLSGLGRFEGTVEAAVRRINKGRARARILALRALLGDEIWQLSASALTMMDQVFRIIRSRPNEFMGGVQIVFCGDPCQLAPIDGIRRTDAPAPGDANFEQVQAAYLFQAPCFAAGNWQYFKLTYSWRHAHDLPMHEHLQALRVCVDNRIPANTYRFLAAATHLHHFNNDEAVTLTCTNRRARAINLARLASQLRVLVAKAAAKAVEAAAAVARPGVVPMVPPPPPDPCQRYFAVEMGDGGEERCIASVYSATWAAVSGTADEKKSVAY